MRRSSPDSTSGRSPDSPDRHVSPDCAYWQPRPAPAPLEVLNSYRAFAGGAVVDLTLADLQLDRARAWLADFVERGPKPATVAARARALRVFGNWIEAEGLPPTPGKRGVFSVSTLAREGEGR